MRKTLLATTALAFAGALAAGQASAADKLSVGVSGYMKQWVGMTSIEEGTYGEGDAAEMREGAMDIRSNSEVYVKGSLEADNGLTFGVVFEFEGNGPGNIDESYAWVSGDFGKLRIGAEDSAHSLMVYGVPNAGLDLGEVRMFFPENEAYYTANWQADNKRIVYMTPRMEGVQLGLSYGPGANEAYGHESGGDLPNNDGDTFSVALNTSHDFAGGTVKLAVGHISRGPDDVDATNAAAQVSMSGITVSVAHLDDDKGDQSMTVAGVMYSDGPISISGNYGMNDKAAGEVSIGMLSMGYQLAPGVALKSSLFASESDATQVMKSDGSMADFEGTGFVTGISLGF